MFATCFKIPVCKVVCFRCILPKCYSGNGSDDDEIDQECKDEGYHSQNRRSSEVTQVPILGAQGGSNEPQDVEMTEMKSTETVVLIPPPRVSTNEYRKDPCMDQDHLEGATGDITYIEVESVSLHRDGSPPEDDSDNIIIPKLEPVRDSKTTASISHSLKLTDNELTHKNETDTDYEIPIHLRFLDSEQSSVVKPKVETGPILAKATDCAVENDDCDNNNDVSSKHYINDDVILVNQNRQVTVVKQENSDSGSIDYANVVGAVSETHQKTPSKLLNGEKGNDVLDDEQHDYLNLNSLDTEVEVKTKVVQETTERKEKKEIKVQGMVNTKSEDIKKMRKDLFSKYSKKKDNYTPKDSIKESTKDSSLKTQVQSENVECVSDSTNLILHKSETEELVTEKVMLPTRISIKDKTVVNGSSSEGEVDDLMQEIVNNETTDQTKLI